MRNSTGQELIHYPPAYLEAREKVCSDLVLGFRSRRDKDFVSYFTGTIGSVPQGGTLGKSGNFSVVAQALLDPERWQDVKTLAMLATCAMSWRPAGVTTSSKETES